MFRFHIITLSAEVFDQELFQISQYVLYTCADLGEIFFRSVKV